MHVAKILSHNLNYLFTQLISNYATQKLFCCMKSCFSVVGIVSRMLGVLFRKALPIPWSWSVFTVVSCNIPLILRSWIHLVLISYMMRDRGLIPFFYMWITMFPSNICRISFFTVNILTFFVKDHDCVNS